MVRDSVPSEYGINLMACFFIVHHHGGKIDANSQPGRGTTFTLRLPLQPERAAAPPGETAFSAKSAAERGTLAEVDCRRLTDFAGLHAK